MRLDSHVLLKLLETSALFFGRKKVSEWLLAGVVKVEPHRIQWQASFTCLRKLTLLISILSFKQSFSCLELAKNLLFFLFIWLQLLAELLQLFFKAQNYYLGGPWNLFFFLFLYRNGKVNKLGGSRASRHFLKLSDVFSHLGKFFLKLLVRGL